VNGGSSMQSIFTSISSGIAHEVSQSASSTPYSSAPTASNSHRPRGARLVAKRAIPYDERAADIERMLKGAGKLPKKKGEDKKQKALDTAIQHFKEVYGRYPIVGVDSIPDSFFSKRNTNGKLITGADNIIRAENLSGVMCGPGRTRVTLFRDSRTSMRMIHWEDSFLFLDAPEHELLFTMPKPSTIGTTKHVSEAVLLNLVGQAGIIESILGVTEEVRDLTTGRSSPVDPSNKGTYIVAGNELSLSGVVSEIDRLVIGTETGCALCTEAKRFLSSVISKRQVLLAVEQVRRSPNPPSEIFCHLIQFDKDASCFQDSPDAPGGFEYADELVFFFYNILVPTSSADDMKVAECYKVRLQLTAAPTVDVTAASFGLADTIAVTNSLRDVALEVEAQNRLDALCRNGSAFDGQVVLMPRNTGATGQAFIEIGTFSDHQEQGDLLDLAAGAWLDGAIEGVAVGHAFDRDGLWHEHLWGVDSEGRVVEFSTPRAAYYGMAVSESEADEFAFSRSVVVAHGTPS